MWGTHTWLCHVAYWQNKSSNLPGGKVEPRQRQLGWGEVRGSLGGGGGGGGRGSSWESTWCVRGAPGWWGGAPMRVHWWVLLYINTINTNESTLVCTIIYRHQWEYIGVYYYISTTMRVHWCILLYINNNREYIGVYYYTIMSMHHAAGNNLYSAVYISISQDPPCSRKEFIKYISTSQVPLCSRKAFI